jgi:hypothetical protein
VNATARNIGIDGNGVSTTQAATSFTGTQAITGHFFTAPTALPVLDPLPCLLHGVSPAHVPTLDLWVLERLRHGLGIGEPPGTQ